MQTRLWDGHRTLHIRDRSLGLNNTMHAFNQKPGFWFFAGALRIFGHVVQQQIIKLTSRTQQSIHGSIRTSLISDLAHLGVLLQSHQSNIAQRTEQAESSGASPSLHAHLCQNGMQAPCQAHTPEGSANLKYICSKQSVVITCHASQDVKTAITVKEETQYSASTC